MKARISIPKIRLPRLNPEITPIVIWGAVMLAASLWIVSMLVPIPSFLQ